VKHIHRAGSISARVVALAGALAVSIGCSSGPDTKGTVDSMGAFGIEFAKVKDSIDDAVKSLERVVNTQPTELKNNFEAYRKSVKDLEDQSQVVKARADEMKAKGDQFFKDWESSKTVSPERRAQLASSYAKIKDDAVVARDAFTPFLNSLKDIDRYLSLDLSLKGVSSMSDLVRSSKEHAAKVKSRIDSVLAEVNSVRGMLSTAK
jgi:predicted  nucleic acid-binding Zn-ribbon protein